MAKGSGTTRGTGPSASSPLRITQADNGYYDVAGPNVDTVFRSMYLRGVEPIVEERYGNIRSGGGTWMGERVLTFRPDADEQTIKNYINDLAKASTLYAAAAEAPAGTERTEARAKYVEWEEQYRNETRRRRNS